MYWYKSWCEIRTVILLGIASIAVACLFIVFHQQSMRDQASEPTTYVALVWKAVYDSFVFDIFFILSIVLGSDGLLHEKTIGTSGFTLALPVSRRRILLTRAFVGYCAVLAMALTPAIVLPLCSRFSGQHYSAAQALGFSLLWGCCGSIFYGYTFLLAHLMEGEHSAILVAITSLMAYRFLMAIPWLTHVPMLNIFGIVNGEDMPFFNESTHLLVGPMPWLALLVVLFIASVFVFLAVRRMETMDF